MKIRFVSWPSLIVAGVGVFLVAILVVQWNLLSRLRRESQHRFNDGEERQRSSSQNGLIEISRADNEEMERLRRENQDLHKLRNEIAQLRQQNDELEKAKAENQRLRQARNAREELARLPKLPDFVPKESWNDAGLSTPEATARTYFWALREGKLDRLLDCMAPSMRRAAAQEFEDSTSKEQASTVVRQLNGYRVAEKTPVSNDEVILGVQAPLFGEKVFKMPMKRIGNEWKIYAAPHQ